jgi:hypothetical protein
MVYEPAYVILINRNIEELAHLEKPIELIRFYDLAKTSWLGKKKVQSLTTKYVRS